MAKPQKQSWVVEVECVVRKEIITDECTEDDAFSAPFDHAIDEYEKDTVDYTVKDVSPNV